MDDKEKDTPAHLNPTAREEFQKIWQEGYDYRQETKKGLFEFVNPYPHGYRGVRYRAWLDGYYCAYKRNSMEDALKSINTA